MEGSHRQNLLTADRIATRFLIASNIPSISELCLALAGKSAKCEPATLYEASRDPTPDIFPLPLEPLPLPYSSELHPSSFVIFVVV